ncbi:MAG: amino acid adenylation domain-containing protein, partial [Verrucomicrobia bacterium]|nr:amino acid adenylation domain-containing protein [Verrucomicrobiota bacterium]
VRETAGETLKWQDYLPVQETGGEAENPAPDPVGFQALELFSKHIATGVSFSITRQSAITSRFQLSLVCTRGEAGWAAELNYDPRVFRREDVQRFADYYQRLLASAVAKPQAAAGALEILEEAERRRLVNDFNQTSAPYPQDQCIHYLFEEQAARAPGRPALACGDRRLSYGELNAQANQIARYLRQRGVKPNDRVALCVERSAEMIIGLLGILKSGAAYVPLIPDNPKARLGQLLQETQAPVLITQEKFLGQLPEFGGDILCFDRDAAKLAKESTNNPERVNAPRDLVYVIYTSGSTGVPKGVGNRHQNLVNYSHFICQRLHLEDPVNSGGLHFATVSTISADLGNTCVFPSLISGGCLHVITYDVSMDGNLFANYAKKNPIDVLKITPSHLNTLLASPEGKSVLPRKYLVLGGEASTWDMIGRIASQGSCQIINHYGPTETTVGSLTYSVAKDDPNAELSATLPIGRPIANTQVYLLDVGLKPVPIGVPGELFISGAGVASGYLNQPEQTTERFLRNPFVSDSEVRMYRTGDLARYLPDGSVEFLGRIDHQVKIRGFRVELAEIEAVLGRNPALQQTIVTAHADKSGDKKLVAYYVVAQGKKTSAEELRNYLKEQLPDYMVPAVLIPLEALPLTPNGKIDRRALPDPETTPAAKEKVYVAPTNPTEEKLAAIWREVLKVERVGIQDDFFELGGHSLLATQVIVRIRSAFEIQLPLRVIFESPTLVKLSAVISEAQKELGGDEDIDALLEGLEDMSDEEAQRLLAEESKKAGG